MKRLAALVMCFSLLLTALPLSAKATDPPKIAFTNYYLNYYDSSIEVQNHFMQALARNTIKFELDANLLSSNVVLDNGTTLSNVPGHASLDLAFNMKNRKAAMEFQTSVAQYDVQGKIYFSEQGVIIPKETVKALTTAGASFPELGDLKQLPDYIVYPSEISSDDWNEIDLQIQMLQNNQSKQVTATRVLLQEILLTVPDKCYYYSGSDPVLDLTQISLESPELLASLKAHSATLADRSAEIAIKPADVSAEEWEAMKNDMKKDIIDTINSLTSEEMAKIAREMPFDVKKCKVTINGSRNHTELALQMNLPDNTNMSLTMQSTSTISAATAQSLIYGDFVLSLPDFKLNISLNGNSSVNNTLGNFDLNITGSGTDQKNTISGKLGLDAKLDWSGSAGITMPALTSANSKIVKRSPRVEQPIRIYLDGQELYFTGNQPWISEGNTMVQLSTMAQSLGCTVDWEPPDTIIISQGSNETLTLYLDSTSYFIDGQEFQSNAVPAVIDSRTYIPLRVLADYYKLTVDWDATARTIHLHRL